MDYVTRMAWCELKGLWLDMNKSYKQMQRFDLDLSGECRWWKVCHFEACLLASQMWKHAWLKKKKLAGVHVLRTEYN